MQVHLVQSILFPKLICLEIASWHAEWSVGPPPCTRGRYRVIVCYRVRVHYRVRSTHLVHCLTKRNNLEIFSSKFAPHCEFLPENPSIALGVLRGGGRMVTDLVLQTTNQIHRQLPVWNCSSSSSGGISHNYSGLFIKLPLIIFFLTLWKNI